MFTLLKGFSTGGSLIVAIGAQNAFVLKQGLMRQHLLLTALMCALIDSALIILGVAGFGHIIEEYPWFIDAAKYFAVAFLVVYGACSLKSAFTNKSKLTLDQEECPSAKKTVLALLGLSLLNPHVYLDTVILLGSIAAQEQQQLLFAMGAIAASFLWFFAITYGARLLTPLLQKKHSWRAIDIIIALTMWGIAFSIIIM